MCAAAAAAAAASVQVPYCCSCNDVFTFKIASLPTFGPQAGGCKSQHIREQLQHTLLTPECAIAIQRRGVRLLCKNKQAKSCADVRRVECDCDIVAVKCTAPSVSTMQLSDSDEVHDEDEEKLDDAYNFAATAFII
jgi:hypothetical protein